MSGGFVFTASTATLANQALQATLANQALQATAVTQALQFPIGSNVESALVANSSGVNGAYSAYTVIIASTARLSHYGVAVISLANGAAANLINVQISQGAGGSEVVKFPFWVDMLASSDAYICYPFELEIAAGQRLAVHGSASDAVVGCGIRCSLYLFG